ncbi:RHOMBOID-like protein 9, chloroplastic isoform X2 [Humulus lupulus]|uniref:RHOMBOID-like protein 9, chloroplastic isoform X2 n=1 Tax=Humulus lupulus TaxID=3486 RepID=UPI002B4032A2|nr:RHOMBOID-like protein 9, chloroplastic isoform X2 [Humulus lupulus]
MAVVPICCKMPYRNQTQHIQSLMRHSDRGMMMTCDSMKLFSVYMYKKWNSSYLKGPILLQTRSDLEDNIRSVSETDSHVGFFCSNQKQLRSLSSYFGKLQEAKKLNPAESSNKALSDKQLCSNKELDILGAYLDKLDKDAHSDKDCSTAEPNPSSFEYQHTIKEDSERREELTMRSYMNQGSRIGSHGQKESQRLHQDDDDDDTSDLYLIILASINIAVVLFEIASPVRSSDMELSSLPLLYGAKVNHLILVGEWWRLITPMFLNCGVFDIGLGCWALLTFGPKVCRGYGSFTFVLIYILGGISGNLISFLHTPKPTIGGTAPIYAIIGAWLIYQIQNKDVISKDVSESLFQKAIIITGLGFILSHFVPIDEWAHFGAAFSGVAYGFLTCPTLQLDDIAASSSGQEEGIALVKRQADPCKSLLWFSLFIVVLSSLLFLIEPPLNDMVLDNFI